MDIMMLRHLYENTDLTLEQIAESLDTTRKVIGRIINNYYTKEYRLQRKSRCYRNSKLGSKNPAYGRFQEDSVRWKNDKRGYFTMTKPEWYTGRQRTANIFVHHVVMCEHLGITEIPAGHCVHHCDLNHQNNEIGNLIMMTMAEHTALHQYLRKLSAEGATTISKESTAKWLEARRAQK